MAPPEGLAPSFPRHAARAGGSCRQRLEARRQLRLPGGEGPAPDPGVPAESWAGGCVTPGLGNVPGPGVVPGDGDGEGDDAALAGASQQAWVGMQSAAPSRLRSSKKQTKKRLKLSLRRRHEVRHLNFSPFPSALHQSKACA